MLFGGAVTEESLTHLLESPQALLNSYLSYQLQNGKAYPTSELRLRVKLYRQAVKFVVSQNELHGDDWQSGLNFLSDLSAEERKNYLGFNASALLTADSAEPHSSDRLSVPSSFSWLDKGAVTPPKDQAKCGSCWAFSSTAALEAAYKIQSGKLKSLSEQEYLDCVYPLNKGQNGCNGGYYFTAWDYNKKNYRMGRSRDRVYTAKAGACSKLPENSLKSHSVTGYTAMPNRNEQDTLLGITRSVLSVAFEVTATFSAYKSGILRDNTCTQNSNHAVAAVGYTPQYILVKNSWGTKWGDRGFVKFSRNHHGCELHKFTAYPTLKPTNKPDNDPEDAATVYDPENREGPTDPYNPGPEPPCVDDKDWCGPAYCGKSYEKYCRKTCGKCTDDNSCPEGTVKCPDGVCRHTHMC